MFLGWKKDFEQVSTTHHVHAYSVITHERRQVATNHGYHWNSIDIENKSPPYWFIQVAYRRSDPPLTLFILIILWWHFSWLDVWIKLFQKKTNHLQKSFRIS